MSVDELITILGEEVSDANEEAFDLFSRCHSSQDLGMVDAKKTDIEITVAGKDFNIKQSPGILQSNRQAGTTGAAVWRASLQFAEWLALSDNILFQTRTLDSHSAVLELGSGISALVPSVLAGRVRRVIATDQQYALKLLQENIDSNAGSSRATATSSKGKAALSQTSNVEVFSLDWEADDIPSFLRLQRLERGVDAVLMCDCIFNYALIQPLVETCTEICRAREHNEIGRLSSTPSICIVAQQLRQPDVFEQWLETFMKAFRVWRVPDDQLGGHSKETSGFVIHIGILR